MIVVEFRQDLLHYGLAEKDSLGTYAELVTVLPDGGHLAVIQVDDLSVPAYKGLLLLLHVFRIHALTAYFLFSGHLWNKVLPPRRHE